MENNTTITLQLSLEEANTILESLGAMPYARVYPLIQNIHAQANGQFAQTEKIPAPKQAGAKEKNKA